VVFDKLGYEHIELVLVKRHIGRVQEQERIEQEQVRIELEQVHIELEQELERIELEQVQVLERIELEQEQVLERIEQVQGPEHIELELRQLVVGGRLV